MPSRVAAPVTFEAGIATVRFNFVGELVVKVNDSEYTNETWFPLTIDTARTLNGVLLYPVNPKCPSAEIKVESENLHLPSKFSK